MANVETRTISFEGLIKQVREGFLRVPRFYRGFVWRREQILTFFDSIRQKYPVGSLLIWRTQQRYASFDRIGPVALPPNEPRAPAEVGYVLDGHQRLSVVFGVFALDDEQASGLSGNDRVFLVYYDLDAERFLHIRYPKPHHLPARYLLGHDDELTNWLDVRRDATETGSPERAQWDMFRRRATQLQTTFAQYRLPYLDMTEASLQEAVNIFSRVNSQGTAVRREEVFAALSWKPAGFDFARAAKDLLDQYPRYRSFGIKPVLQSVLAALGEFIYDTDWGRILEEHQAKLPGAMEEVGTSLGRALDFLDERIGASSGKVVPYSVHIVVLTELFRRYPDPGPSVLQELERWLWATSFASAFSAANEQALTDAVDRIQRLASGERVSLLPERLILRPFPRRFHAKSARVRVFHLFLKSRGPRDLSTGELLHQSMLLRNGMGDAQPVTSRSLRLAGRFLVAETGRRTLQRDLEALALAHAHAQPSLAVDPAQATDPAAILRSHLIPDDALVALRAGDLDAFIDLRERELIREERAFAKQYVDLTDEEVEEEPEIDVEEEPESDL